MPDFVRRTRHLGAALLVAVLASSDACTRRAPRPQATPGGPRAEGADSGTSVAARARAIPLDVENNYRADVTVLLVRGQQRRRLGTVPPNSRRRLQIPETFAADQGGFSLFADPVAGGESVSSQTVVARAGQRLVWTLESRLSRSVLVVY